MFDLTIIVGRLGADPETDFTKNGRQVAHFSVAVDRGEKTTWFRVTAWDKQAEACAKYLHKGDPVLVQGQVSASAYVGDDGEAHPRLELTARVVKFLPGGSQ